MELFNFKTSELDDLPVGPFPGNAAAYVPQDDVALALLKVYQASMGDFDAIKAVLEQVAARPVDPAPEPTETSFRR